MPDSLAERGEFELPVPICEQSDDSIRLSFCDIETNCKALSPCSAFLVRFRVAGSDPGKMACPYWIATATSGRDVVHRARGEGLLYLDKGSY
jgi:hypothetical protein